MCWKTAAITVWTTFPSTLVVPLLESLAGSGHEHVALSMDARSGASVRQLPQTVAALKQKGVDVRLLFLEAKDETLIKRFSETRRRHPLSQGGLTVAESIARERELLDDIGEFGHHVDTSELSPNTLRSWIKNLVEVDRSRLTLLFESFGFKQGIPLDADFVFDVRCLPNPYYEPGLRDLTGLDAAVVGIPGEGRSNAEHVPRHPRLHRHLAARVRARKPQLSHRCHRLHRRTAPFRVFRRTPGRRFRRRQPSHDPAPADPMKKTVTLALTGASGMAYGIRLLECLIKAGVRVYLIYSQAAQVVAKQEIGLTLPARAARRKRCSANATRRSRASCAYSAGRNGSRRWPPVPTRRTPWRFVPAPSAPWRRSRRECRTI